MITTFLIEKMEFRALWSDVIFLFFCRKFFGEIKIGHFKNVQNQKSKFRIEKN
jgi:hypothetical protein